MTNDNFTEAAYTEAERQNPVPPTHDPEGPSQWERLLAQQAFRNGAEWARTHLAAQEPTDDEVETAARAMRIETLAGTVRPGAAARWWDNGDVSPDEADKLRRLARAALSATRNARRDEENR